MKRPSSRMLPLLFSLGRPFSPLYSLAMRLRQKAYEAGVFRRSRVCCPVISIGNICLGGTGKTPHVIALAKWLQERGLRPAIVSRGYGGKAGKGPLIVSDQSSCLADALLAGDEPSMMARTLPGVPVISGSDRVKGAETAISRFNSRTIILDDGFQHLRLHRDLDIVLLPAASPLGTGTVFPGGDLREPLSALKRASAIILSKCEQVPFNELELIREQAASIAPGIPVFLSRTVFKAITLADGSGTLEPPFPSHVHCFCAIAKPEAFIRTVSKQGIEVRGTDFYPDHQILTSRDLSRIFERAAREKAGMVLTTSKDFARIKGVWEESFRGRKDFPQLGVVEIEAEPEPGFWRFLEWKLLPIS